MKRQESKYWNHISSPYDGGRFVNEFGYVQFRFRDENGKLCTPLEHRMVMEYTLGRKLRRAEIVHHINGSRQDNREENLILMTVGQHQHLHNKNHPWKTGFWY